MADRTLIYCSNDDNTCIASGAWCGVLDLDLGPHSIYSLGMFKKLNTFHTRLRKDLKGTPTNQAARAKLKVFSSLLQCINGRKKSTCVLCMCTFHVYPTQ